MWMPRCALLFRLSLPCVALSGAACDGPPPDPTVEIGSSADPLRHRSLPDGAAVWITYGLQGGYHIWGSFAAEHVDPDDVRMEWGLFADGVQVGGADYRDDLLRGPDGPYEYGGVTVFVYDDVPPESLDGRSVEMTLRLTDGGGEILEDRMTVLARCCE